MRDWIGVFLVLVSASPGTARTFLDAERPVFTQTLNSVHPLAFGMTATDAAIALGAPLTYLRGRPGNETYLAIRTHGGGGFFPRADRLFLQFRHGQLTGLKGDWGKNWMWR